MTDQTPPIATARAIISNTQYQTIINSGKHSITADEPEELEGSDTGMNPNELLLASLSSCTAITLQMYINRKMWVVGQITVDLEMFAVEGGTLIKRKLSFKGELIDAQKQRLERIAEACPIHKILTGNISIETAIL